MSKELNHFAAILHVYAVVWFLWSKKIVIIFQKENGNTFTLFIIFIVKSLQKEQNSTNLLLRPPICRNKSAITPKCFNSLDTNSRIPHSRMSINDVRQFLMFFDPFYLQCLTILIPKYPNWYPSSWLFHFVLLWSSFSVLNFGSYPI